MFTPVQTFLGGLLLHFSTSSLLENTGRVFGISGILQGAVLGAHDKWQFSILGGLLAGPIISHVTGLQTLFPGTGPETIAQIGLERIILAGTLVGFGTRLGSGCTSGHMLCGVSRLSPRSLLATMLFFTTAVITANLSPPPISSSVAYALEIPSRTTAAVLLAVVAGAALVHSRLALLNDQLKQLPFILCGITFSLGLSVSGMSDPAKVQGFLQLFNIRKFDPSLALILVGGVFPNAIHYARMEKKARLPWETWNVPSRTDVDWQLIIGSLIFGVGWGLTAICPGPALVCLSETVYRWVIHDTTLPSDALTNIVTFTCAVILSMALGSKIPRPKA
ncbi:uncharacterized protein IL334_001218 [Kwoniella shivajii]|uniref:Sulphur transport domain-containing protein n=1 Tax=Kwoniella shivajii TaxID=564305 RepID=A0ABZ1CVI9_9TREE|nr:hypothetical protein IL334_001218 [Kwoniella shivajii]